MNGSFRKYGYFMIAAVLVFAPAAFAQTSMTLTGVGNGYVVNNSTAAYNFGVYVDPYTATITSPTSTQTNVPVICDDWSDNSYVNATWNVSVGSISSAGLTGTPLFGASLGSAGQLQLYQELAYLSTMLLQVYNNTSLTTNQQAADQAGISFAIWNLTYGLGPNTDTAHPPLGFLNTSGDSAAITAYNNAMTSLNNAIATDNLGGVYAFQILTPNPEGPNEAQEFLVQAPESSTVIMFGADMLGLLAVAFYFRRRSLLAVS